MNKRIMLGIPVNRWLSPQFSISLQKLTFYLSQTGWTTEVNYDSGSVLTIQRNKIMRTAEKAKMDLLFIDSDMIFDATVFEKMYVTIESNSSYDLVGGLCFMRRFPFQPVVFAEDRVDDEGVFKGMKLQDMPPYPFECAGVGCAFLYIPFHTIEKIFDEYKFPFNLHEMKNGECLGEDLSFFYRINLMGLKTICVPDVEIGHITEHIITREDHLAALCKINKEAAIKNEN